MPRRAVGCGHDDERDDDEAAAERDQRGGEAVVEASAELAVDLRLAPPRRTPPITAAAMPIAFETRTDSHGAVSGFPSKSTTE